MDSDSPMSEANNQIVLSDVLSKSHEEQESLSIEQGQSSEGEAPAAVEDEEMEEAEEMENNNYQLMMIPEQEREYGCRYCRKKFSNKQALGGHQNAHKVERAMEKNDEETGGIGFYARYSPYHGRMSMVAAAPFLTHYHRHPDFLHRPLYNWNFASQQMVGGGVVAYNPRPPPHGFNGCIYHPWSSAPRLPAFTIRPHYTLPVHIRLTNFGPGSSNTFRSGPDQGFPPGFGIRPAAPINLRNVPEVEHDESGLDLSLRLGYDDF